MAADDSKKAEKEAEKERKAEMKVLDAADEAFVGYLSLQTLDQDGIAGRTLGSGVQAPVKIVSEDGAATVVFEAHFLAENPLFFLELRNEEQFFLWGRWWVGGPKHSEASQVCSMVPIKMQDCHRQEEKTPHEFKAQAQCEVLRQSTSRLFEVSLATQEKKFKTKVTRATLTMPREAWLEFKQHRVRMWKAGKNWAATEQEPEEKKEEKKDEKTKEEEKK